MGSRICISGTVGVGKSTLTRALSRSLELPAMYEDSNGNPYLERYYSDFSRWSFHVQIHFLAQRLKNLNVMEKTSLGYIQDRSIYEDVGIFGRMQYEKGNMSEEEFSTYSLLAKNMMSNPPFTPPDLLIHIEGPLDRIIERMQLRGRMMETKTQNSYWEELYERYSIWVDGFSMCPLMRLQIDEYDCEDEDSVHEIVDGVTSLLNESRETKQRRHLIYG